MPTVEHNVFILQAAMVSATDVRRRIDRMLKNGIWHEDDEAVLNSASKQCRLWAKVGTDLFDDTQRLI